MCFSIRAENRLVRPCAGADRRDLGSRKVGVCGAEVRVVYHLADRSAELRGRKAADLAGHLELSGMKRIKSSRMPDEDLSF